MTTPTPTEGSTSLGRTAEMLLAHCRRYIAAEHRRHQTMRHGRINICRIRALEVTADLDEALTRTLYRSESALSTGTDAALIKAAARRVGDALGSADAAAAYEQLRQIVFQVLSDRAEAGATTTEGPHTEDPAGGDVPTATRAALAA